MGLGGRKRQRLQREGAGWEVSARVSTPCNLGFKDRRGTLKLALKERHKEDSRPRDSWAYLKVEGKVLGRRELPLLRRTRGRGQGL